ncbi:DUF2589 domain-containing protein [Rheinheimera sp.]|uniref:DUF2589 domain-containing protein n=1 Tax=Rheinheimera sp. TaxID=1869214 RepID=UPI002732ACD2|nr:DUF2589 domain-containing protein [Rheinheimera sp.]MDP2713862.1 DUF2589 domain-containing protein [Rheinheimera sp.]
MALEDMRNHFTGLPMQDLIGTPLKAACDAQLSLARSTYEFIRDVGFDGDKTRNADFSFTRHVVTGKDALGNDIMDEQRVALEVPVLAIVNVPALMVDQVDITFDMEVRSSEASTETEDRAFASKGSASVGWGVFKASVEMSGSVASHKENTRKSDNSAKYHVSVHASQAGTPEGLSRVLDIIAGNVSPKQVESTERKRLAEKSGVPAAITAVDEKTRALDSAEADLRLAQSNLRTKQNTQAARAQISTTTDAEKAEDERQVKTAEDDVAAKTIAVEAARADAAAARTELDKVKLQ